MSNNIGNLTMREVATVEELTGAAISALSDSERPQGKALAAIAYVIKRRTDQDFTFDNALDMDFTEIQALLGLDADEDPLANG
jgi:hypothetical protein